MQLDGPSTWPNDPLLPQQYALKNINMTRAWDAGAFGSNGVHVCMVDTGLDYFHPDLLANLWTNPGEVPNNGIDDDHNGETGAAAKSAAAASAVQPCFAPVVHGSCLPHLPSVAACLDIGAGIAAAANSPGTSLKM